MKLELTPIGIIHSPHREANGTPIQPRWAEQVEGTVVVFAEFAAGLRDLDGFDRVWLIFLFDRARAPQLEVTPYRDSQPRGVFATRAPSRPNPIGLSCVRLLAVEGCSLRVAGLDVLDGTPLLDIKPYVPDFDVFEVSKLGWYGAARGPLTADGRFEKVMRPSAVADTRAILDLLARRSCTAEEVAGALGLCANEALKRLQALVLSGDVITVRRDGQRVYATRRIAP
jgi:tRNA-Thr(GGU) m(6)t(6)A37 methyltransferase TsaA